jgi:hypothetical protein
MAEVRDMAHEVCLRTVEDQDLDVFFDHQADPEAAGMAAFPSRDKDQFAVHNTGSIRVLEKCAFRRDRVQEATAPAPDDGIEEFIFVLDA